ncbi:hypothetical protein PCL1391_2205 [Pseudomonas chlororaphis subsp. piscium]|nr:hypothetical protein C4K33_2424 [Pseudomonas chlororaphis subsp. piscium]AZC69152.1 hypothetical protein C4K32_2490 [Pseudomonas chlororaphis subsp. piscium]AZC88806.1 hypothetical protein C4K29_2505 [Pseudomonas chlororaphis subsp. piscium]AZD85452.1 hypothetical protein C4K14_2628 [Pseudomonas chlororaphis subsp. aureofaciens]KZO49250.1 hypothetical protein PCL1391_2205 [Pseudomonas chlororaphis subsp. piscium]
MIIDALYKSKKSLFRYNTDTGQLLFSQSERLWDRLSAEGFDCTVQDAKWVAGAIYESERSRIHYTGGGKAVINQRMRTQAVLFGKPRPRYAPSLIEARGQAVEGGVFEAIRFAFKNTALTPWAINGLGPGVRRVYPSNGAVHSLECCYTDRHGNGFLYDSYCDRFFVIHDDAEPAERPGTLVVQCDFERLAERYRDVRSLSALYIESGHAIAVLFHALQLRNIIPLSLTLTGFNRGVSDYCSSIATITL